MFSKTGVQYDEKLNFKGLGAYESDPPPKLKLRGDALGQKAKISRGYIATSNWRPLQCLSTYITSSHCKGKYNKISLKTHSFLPEQPVQPHKRSDFWQRQGRLTGTFLLSNYLSDMTSSG